MRLLERLREQRRTRILERHPISDVLWERVVDELAVLSPLEASELVRLRELATLFLHQKRFFGAHGLVIDDYMRVVIAAQACLPVLNLGLDHYRGWHTVILYPETFVAHHVFEDEIGVVHEGEGELDGESVEGGAVVLSWAEAAPGEHRSDGGNVVVHELAHKLDYLTGMTNGLPPLHEDMSAADWSRVMTSAFEAIGQLADHDPDALPFDDYAAEDPGEFFAVMSEYFFESPDLLNAELPDVYAQFARFYRQDPLARRTRGN